MHEYKGVHTVSISAKLIVDEKQLSDNDRRYLEILSDEFSEVIRIKVDLSDKTDEEIKNAEKYHNPKGDKEMAIELALDDALADYFGFQHPDHFEVIGKVIESNYLF